MFSMVHYFRCRKPAQSMPTKACLPSALADAPKSTFSSKRSGDSSCRSKVSSNEGSSNDLKRSSSGHSYARTRQQMGTLNHRTPSVIMPAVTKSSQKSESATAPYRNAPAMRQQDESSPDTPNQNFPSFPPTQNILNNRISDHSSLNHTTNPTSLMPPQTSVHPTSISGTSSSSNRPLDSVSNSIKSAMSHDKKSRRTALDESLKKKKESTKSKLLKSLSRDKSDKSPSPPPVATVEFKLVEDLRLVTIPVTSCLFVLFAYIALGTILFANWENWTYMDGVYFCFISLLTIGFGDFVPGNKYIYHVDKDEDEMMGKAKLISGTIYILLGLAIIAMCLNLMHEKIVVSLRTLAKRLGLIRPTTFYFTNDEEDEDDNN